MSDFNRRTVVRGAAWTVPVVAVAAQAPVFAASNQPPPPDVNLGGSCANTGAVPQKGCGIVPKSLQIPVTVRNTSAVPIVFQVVSLYTKNGGPAPTGPDDPGAVSGVSGIFATNSGFAEHTCGSVKKSTCDGGAVNGSVEVAAGATAYLFVVSNENPSSSDFTATITTRLLDAATCAAIPGTQATKSTVTAISNNNCD